MKDRIFVDTNILVYALLDDSHKQQIALNLLQSGCVISTQVLNEFTNVARKKAKLEWQEIQDLSNAIQSLSETAPLDLPTHNRALTVAASYGYSFYDSLIIAAALESGCNLLFSEDMQHGQKFETLVMTNPFA
ncbi:MAG TPA: PIN domain-containing protein [Cellvibrio sp.]|nr:PIN domain-containing protein [Cellvibrio sp.]